MDVFPFTLNNFSIGAEYEVIPIVVLTVHIDDGKWLEFNLCLLGYDFVMDGICIVLYYA